MSKRTYVDDETLEIMVPKIMKNKKPRRRHNGISSELRFAMLMASSYWNGTSITDGAFHLMEYVRKTSPEQFKNTDEHEETASPS